MARSNDSGRDQQASVAYLAFVIRYVRGWLILNRPRLFHGRKPVWFVNLGMPAAVYETKITARYRSVGVAARKLALTDESISIESSGRLLADSDVVEAGLSSEAAEECGVAVIPEAAAQMTGFSMSSRRASGLYLLVDIGALTLDVCMFRLNQYEQGESRYAFMNTEVRPFGVESFYWFKNEGKTTSEFIKQCDVCLRSVVWDTKMHRDPGSDVWNSVVPVFLAGGGAANRLHRKRVEALGPWLRHFTGNDGIRLIEMPFPRSLDLPEPTDDIQRMTVAWGLSYPSEAIGAITPEKEIEDIPPPMVVDGSDWFISKDQV